MFPLAFLLLKGVSDGNGEILTELSVFRNRVVVLRTEDFENLPVGRNSRLPINGTVLKPSGTYYGQTDVVGPGAVYQGEDRITLLGPTSDKWPTKAITCETADGMYVYFDPALTAVGFEIWSPGTTWSVVAEAYGTESSVPLLDTIRFLTANEPNFLGFRARKPIGKVLIKSRGGRFIGVILDNVILAKSGPFSWPG